MAVSLPAWRCFSVTRGVALCRTPLKTIRRNRLPAGLANATLGHALPRIGNLSIRSVCALGNKEIPMADPPYQMERPSADHSKMR